MKPSRFMCLKVLGAGALLAATTGAPASDLFAVNFAGTTPFYRVDQSNGSLTTINPAAARDIGDLTSDQNTTVWGVTLPLPSVPGGNSLVTFDPGTGNVVKTVPITGVEVGNITSLAWSPETKILYGNTTPGFGDPTGDNLYKIDPSTGVATFVGKIMSAAGGPFTNIYALGFDQGGRLFGISDTTNQLLGINPATGAASVIAMMQVNFAFDIASRPEDNKMFLVDSGSSFLYGLDTSNGALSGIGPWSPPANNLVGLAFAVPEPGTWAMLLGGLALLGLIGRRRFAV